MDNVMYLLFPPLNKNNSDFFFSQLRDINSQLRKKKSELREKKSELGVYISQF